MVFVAENFGNLLAELFIGAIEFELDVLPVAFDGLAVAEVAVVLVVIVVEVLVVVVVVVVVVLLLLL